MRKKNFAGSCFAPVRCRNDIAGSITVPQNVTASDSKSYNVSTAVKLTGAVQVEGSVFGGGNGDYTYYSAVAAYEGSSAANKVLVANVDDKPVVDGGALVDVNTGALPTFAAAK